MKWLPELISCNGNWHTVLETLYARFRADFIDSQATFQGLRVRLPYAPLAENKEPIFWHLISEGEREDERIPDFRRCERIGWVRAIIDNAGDPNVKIWEQNRPDRRTVIALPDFSYIVFLAQRRPQNRDPYAMLRTAYNVEKNKQREKYRKECEAWQEDNP